MAILIFKGVLFLNICICYVADEHDVDIFSSALVVVEKTSVFFLQRLNCIFTVREESGCGVWTGGSIYWLGSKECENRIIKSIANMDQQS